MSKPPLTFKPAPRPAAAVDADTARRMAEASADLGFTRTTSAPKPEAIPTIQGGGGPPAGTDSATAPLPERPIEPSAQGSVAQSTESAIEPSADRPVEQSADEATAQPTERATAPSPKGTVARSAERAKARRANIAIAQGRNVSIARPPDGATAQLAKGPFAPVAGTVKLEVQDPLWTELRVAAAQRRVSIRYLVHEALAAQGYTVNLDEIPPDGRRVR